MKKSLFIFTFLLVFTFLAMWGYLQTSHAQKIILSFITETIKKNTGHDVEIEGFTFPLPFNWVAYHVKIKENEKIWLSIDELEISFHFWALLNKTIILKNITLVNVHVDDLPATKSTGSLHEIDFWDTMPFQIKIPKFHIINLTVNQKLYPDELFSQILPLDLEGALALRPQNQIIDLDLSLKKYEPNKIHGATHFHFVSQKFNEFIFRFQLIENQQGLISQVANIKFPENTMITIEGKKGLDNAYDGQFNLKFLKAPNSDLVIGKFFLSNNGQLIFHSIPELQNPFTFDGEFLLDAEYKIHKGLLNLDLIDTSFLGDFISIPLSGSGKIHADFSGSLKEPVINFKLLGDRLKLHEESIENFLAEATINKSPNGFMGHTYFDFGYRQIPFKANGLLKGNEKSIFLTDFQATYGNAEFKGDINYNLEQAFFDGWIKGQAKDSSVFQNLFDLNLHGSTSLSIKCYGADTFGTSYFAQNLDFNIAFDRARYENFQVEKATLSGNARDIFKYPNADIFLAAKHAVYNGWRLQELSAETTIDHSKNFWPFEFSTHDTPQSEVIARGKGHWRMTPRELDLHLEKLKGRIKKHSFNLQDPVTLYMQKEIFDLSPLSINIGQGTLYTTVDYRFDQAHATTRFKEIPIEIFYPPNFILPFTGILNGEAYLFGTPEELSGQMQMHLSQIKIQDDAFDQTPPFAANLTGNISKSGIACSVQLLGVTPKPVEMIAELPITFSLNPPSLNVDEKAPLSARLVAEGDIAPLLQLLVIETTTLTGKTSVTLNVTGTFENPHVSGTVAIANGTFESPNTGAFFHHLNARLEANDKTLVLQDFKAMDLNDGIVKGKGILELNREQGFPFTLNLNLTRIRLLNLDFVKSIASGDVVVTGTIRSGKIKGHLTTDLVQATIPEQASALAHSLEVKYINLKKGEVSPIFTTSRPRWPLELDVQIDAQKNATIKSKNLSSYWQGGVKVAGLAHSPQIFGDFKIVKGEYNFNGKIFDIKEGTISFAGEPEKKTTLYVIASKDLGKMVADVILRGSIKNPSIAFRSNPPMPQREILSWILFGRGSTDITPFQGSELSQSINNLAEKSQKEPDVLSKIRDKIGIDRIDINKKEGGESNEVSLQVGKYLSKKVLLKVNKGITSQSNQVGIEANILPNIKAEAQVGDDSSTQLQLKWKRDY